MMCLPDGKRLNVIEPGESFNARNEGEFIHLGLIAAFFWGPWLTTYSPSQGTSSSAQGRHDAAR
ncbi:hypothetical protein ABTB68_19135, partial [Acinetobacter baumannii]